jgi:hypothetical protein
MCKLGQLTILCVTGTAVTCIEYDMILIDALKLIGGVGYDEVVTSGW